MQPGELLVLPPWVSLAMLPKPSTDDAPAESEAGSAPGNAAHDPHASAATILHFALPGDSAAMSSLAMPADFERGQRQGRPAAEPSPESGGAGGAEPSSNVTAAQQLSAHAQNSAPEGLCNATRWWAFGSPVAVYDLVQARPRC